MDHEGARRGRRARSRPRAWVWPLLLAPLLTTMYYAVPSASRSDGPLGQAVYSSASLVAVVCLAAGAVRRRRPGPWWLLAAGQAGMCAGDVVHIVLTRQAAGQPAYPNVSDLLYLAGSGAFAGALLWLVRRRTPGWDTPSLVDAAVVAVSVGLVDWVYLIEPMAAGGSGAAQAVTVAYPAVDLVLLAIGVRLMLGTGARTASLWLLVGWLTLILAGDTVYSVESLLGRYDGAVVDGVWMFGMLALAAAGLHPSAARLDAPSATAAPDATGPRLAVLACASVVAPVVLLGQYTRGAPLHVPEVAVACIVLFLLVLARMAGLVRVQRAMAITDGLTGLRTRRYFETALRGEAERTRRSGGSIGLLLIDVDHFKQVNDVHGHQAGDRVLTEVARRLRTLARPGDVVARYGGEEFAVLLPGAGHGPLEIAAARLQRGLSSTPYAIADDRLLAVTVSVGGACLPLDAIGPDELARIADQGLYAAKHAGRNRAVVTGAARSRRTAGDERPDTAARRAAPPAAEPTAERVA